MGKIRIKFHKELYPVAAIKKAIKDFEEVARMLFEKQKEYYLVSIDNPKIGNELLVRNNFINYVLILSRTTK